MNIDTDTQWAFLCGVRDYVLEFLSYLWKQVGNPSDPDDPNKKKIDPRSWLRKGEESMRDRLLQAFQDLKCWGRNDLLTG